MYFIYRNIKLVFLSITLFLLTACSTQNTYRTLSFIFDGVPNPKDASIADLIDTMQIASESNSSLNTIKSLKPQIYVHLPYLDKECASCHNQGRMGSLNDTEPSLCFRCHEDFSKKNSHQHGPVSAGYCSNCHHPHKSKFEKLLLLEESNLCYLCHESGLVFESIFHNISDEKDCGKCHDPHGSNNHSMLNEGACYLCHDNFEDTFSYIHGPVDAGLCSICHSSHATGSNKMIQVKGNSLCTNCHNSGSLSENVIHIDNNNMNCTECHDPHGGYDQYMFK